MLLPASLPRLARLDQQRSLVPFVLGVVQLRVAERRRELLVHLEDEGHLLVAQHLGDHVPDLAQHLEVDELDCALAVLLVLELGRELGKRDERLHEKNEGRGGE